MLAPLPQVTEQQCCGAGPFVCGIGSILSKISAPVRLQLRIRPLSSYILEKNQKFSCFLKPKIIINTFFKVKSSVAESGYGPFFTQGTGIRNNFVRIPDLIA
jgi:hypothetical protein